MSFYELLLPLLVCVPVFFGVLCVLPIGGMRVKFGFMLAGIVCGMALDAASVARVFGHRVVSGVSGWFFLDSLSAYNLIILTVVFFLSSCYAVVYFGTEIRAGRFTVKQAGRFNSLWLFSCAAMHAVLVSNNITVMWVGIEATTLLTAFLISLHERPFSLEAMWKYIIICSVGIALAFIGTIFVTASAKALPVPADDLLFWTVLNENAAGLDQTLVKAGFIFLIIGYGTKAGLAPLHTWLPDAHSQAPSPVSAMFSGFMLSLALYCVTRFIPVVEKATGFSGWALTIFNIFGLLSLVLAAVFILFQNDLKRLLAYSSIEHMGIISLWFGLGGLGTFAALFHTLNHSLGKLLAFFAAGKTGQAYGTYDMRKIGATAVQTPVWGIGLLGALLVLMGVAPFSIFLSELMLVQTAIRRNAWFSLVVFLLAAALIFMGILKRIITITWGGKNHRIKVQKAGVFAYAAVFSLLGVLLVLGLHIPEGLNTLINNAASIVNGGR
jgi:hydrogenase-4 component F